MTSATTLSDSANVPEIDRVRDTMSFSNILTPPSTGAPDVTVDAPVLAPPPTPVKAAKTSPKEEVDSPEAVMSNSDDLHEGDADAVDVPDSEREFICMNDEHTRCITGQYTKALSRKVISDHFGRNKACTRDITNWPLFCRKHYQRATYNKHQWQLIKLRLIYNQFDVIEKQFPGTTYDINFKKSEENRINGYSRKVASGVPEDQAAKDFAPSQGKNFEAPISVLRELDYYMEKDKQHSLQEVRHLTEVILKLITDKETLLVPAIEFLPNLPHKAASPKKATKAPKTPSPKKSRAPKTPGSKGNPGRISAKGSVKKPQK
ncbi:hypothetical protein BDU57DRAFT_507785 [Ampelomyces quisqualis]|uniref:Uncharacterized protein n=1 Tax=Ampelomyces quisqualis TaxID=50730 RepID=A0A6A5Q4Y5_AMPQU|nr:hypothetical protein BDU57DRAFT_507785 [Ampelomyces quisqualis]